ncbi:MAG: hypothetical protein Q8R24_11025 [Legionellaceae bacterium]|nr:hypothetical protein [Legionellaceae bacterium]
MGSEAFRLDMRSNKHAHEQIRRLIDYVSGQLNDVSLSFFHDVCSKNAAALEKLITKCQQLKIKLKADDVDKVLESLHKQMHLPKNILETIQYYLLDKRMNSIANVLNSVSSKLECHVSSSDVLQATWHVISNLNLLINSSPEEQFLRSIITMMLDFQNKEHHSAKSCNPKKRSADDASKWLRTLLAVSEKSDLTKLIDLLADRLHLGGNMISGGSRNMDFTELFFLFEDIAIQAEMQVTHESNQKLILDINAIMLTTFVCKRIPTAFFDVVSQQQDSSSNALLPLMQQYYQKPLVIEQFFNSQGFQNYYRVHRIKDQTNQHAFLTSFVNYLHAITSHQNDRVDANIQTIVQFLELCRKQSSDMSDHEFILWLEQASVEHKLEVCIQSFLFNAIEREVELNNNRIGSLVFVANKLVSMGFSPRAASVATTGFFQPLITPNVLQTDAKNFKALELFLETLQPNQRKQLTHELMLSALVRYRKRPTNTLETTSNQPKIATKRPADNNHPIPTLHNLKKSKSSRTTRIERKRPSFSGSFFNENPPKISLKRNTPKFVVRH